MRSLILSLFWPSWLLALWLPVQLRMRSPPLPWLRMPMRIRLAMMRRAPKPLMRRNLLMMRRRLKSLVMPLTNPAMMPMRMRQPLQLRPRSRSVPSGPGSEVMVQL
uniref:MIP04451p n=1 Tax=Drosophila melanogaster TaxID=7227 RepID=C3KGR3_DROME|nr:MIP04451p [Drosophila melanogaster]